MHDLDTVLDTLDRDRAGALERLFKLVRIPSISTDPAFEAQCVEAAEALRDDLSGMGFDASVRTTPGHPMVVGHYTGAGEDAPHYLFYGHYDVQPPDPLDLWHSPPFEPQIVTRDDGSQMVRARGAQDDKGQLMTFFEACRAWISATGALPCNVTVFLEGEEESGSPSLGAFLDENADELRKDAALVCDTAMWDRDTPAICTGLRGLLGEEIVIKAADIDLHSGSFGGAAQNPIRVLARLLAGLHDENGRVTLPGFYDGVPETPDAQKAQWQALGFDPAGFLGAVGLSEPAGETDRSVMEQLWARPTCEYNGIVGGYTGAGFKTVLPAQASVKLSCRLVGDQDPHAIRRALHAYIRENVPPDCEAEFHDHGASGGISLSPDNPVIRRAKTALTAEWGKEAALIGMGGSIPVVGEFKDRLGLDCLLVGFGLADDAIHSPNEKYELASFHRGARSWARILAELAKPVS